MIAAVKSTVRQTVAWAGYRSGASTMRQRGKITVLTYHRVLSEDDQARGLVQPGMYVGTPVFDMHVKFLKAHYDVIGLNDLIEVWKKGNARSHDRYCVITFDDGWLDGYTNAYPILTHHRVPATMFLPTSYIGTRGWFWTDRLAHVLGRRGVAALLQDGGRDAADLLKAYPSIQGEITRLGRAGGDAHDALESLIGRLKAESPERIERFIEGWYASIGEPPPDERLFVNWEEVREMADHGIRFGSHSATHRILTTISVDEVRNELSTSLSVLREKTSHWVPVFCYPNGSSNPDISAMVGEAGYDYAVGGAGLESTVPRDPFHIRRIGVHQDIARTASLFSWRLLGFR
ncbi:MAG: polysaccharide deacetylase family protein [Nitrospiria bacterium]